MPEKNPPRVVLVEDHTMVRQLLAHLVRQELGLNLVADCTNVADGCAALLREKPDLAIVDWMLPDGRGFDLVRTAGPKLTRTRWLFISSNEQGHLVREAVSFLCHQIMEAEVAAQIGAGHGERAPAERATHRNGYRERRWDTRAGSLELFIPKLRAGSYG